MFILFLLARKDFSRHRHKKRKYAVKDESDKSSDKARRNEDIPCMALLTLYLILCPYLASAADLKEGEAAGKRIIATVNSRPIYEEQLTPRVEAALKKYKKYGMQSPTPDLLKSERERELDHLIDEELVIQASNEMEIPDIEKKIDEHIKSMKETYPRKTVQEHLARRG